MGSVSIRHTDEKERVRDASDIVRVVGEHIALKASGREYLGLCPFHDDHKPSMTVVPAKQIFHCFVCGSGGDVFSFIEKYHKMEFREALEYLAERAGIELAPRRAQAAQESPSATRADIVRANAVANDFFRGVLAHPEHGRAARAVVERRGISTGMVEAFQIGASADRWDGLLLTIQRRSLSPALFAEAGLLKRRESDGGHYDVFRNRLIFPIQDQLGRVIAFGGRRINDEDDPKYLNSPETRAFEKAGTLYGLHQAARAIQAERIAVVTEGYTDTIACHQAGIQHVVATLGTALTARHAAVLRRLCDTVVLLFDGDQAGQKAADRAVEVFFSEAIDVRIATLAAVTDAKDPDELLQREGGADLLRRAIASATDLLEYRFRRLRASLAGAGLSATARAVEEELNRLIELGLNEVSPVRRNLIVRELPRLAGVPAQTIADLLRAGRSGGSRRREATESASVRMGIRDHLLGCVLCEPRLWASLPESDRAALAPEKFESPATSAIASSVKTLSDSDREPDLKNVLAALDDDDARQGAVALATRIDLITERSPERLRAYWDQCLRSLALDGAKLAAPLTAEGCSDHPEEQAPTHPAGEGSLAARIERERQRHAALGGDRRVLPRPTG